MLPLYVDHGWMYVVKIVILFCGMFFNNHVCDSSGTNEICTLNNILFVSNKTLQSTFYFPSDVVYNNPNGSKLCFALHANRTQDDCCKSEDFNCNIQVDRQKNEYIVTLNEEALSKHDVVVMTVPDTEVSCLPSTLYNETGFLLNINKCLDKGVRNVRLSKDGFCGKNSTYDEQLCKAFTETNSSYKVIFKANGHSCLCCKLPGNKPEISVVVSVSDEATSQERASNIMKSLSSVLDQMGNSSTASISMSNVKGVISKLPQENPASIYIGFTESGANIIEEEKQLAGFSRSVKIPEEASDIAIKRNGTFAGVLLFSGMKPGENNSYFLNDEAVGIEMGAKISNLSQTIDIKYANVEKIQEGYSASCRSWDGQNKTVWITDGCQTVETNTSITCQCSHLTFFAILLSPPPTNISASDVKSLSYITSIGCGLSSFFLAVALFMHFLIRKGKASQGTKILMNLFIAMFALNVCFLINGSIANLGNFGACMAMAAALHYSMLATFTWFFMQALHLYFNLHKLSADIKHYMMKICITGWVTPAVVVIVLLALKKYDTLVINTNDGKTEKMCWISDAALHQGVNIGYYAVVFVFTFSIFIVTVRQITPSKFAKEKVPKVQAHSSNKINYSSILGLFLLLGITWGFAFFSHGPLLIPSYYIFTILNTFQGFFLFIYYYRSSKIVGGDTNLTPSSSTSTSKPAHMNIYTSPYS